MSKKGNNGLLVALSAFAGGIVAGLLIAPRTGKETRDFLNEQARLQSGKVAEKAREIAQESSKTAQQTWKQTQSTVKQNLDAFDHEVHWDKNIGTDLSNAINEVAGGKRG